jgi:hypothetical protein
MGMEMSAALPSTRHPLLSTVTSYWARVVSKRRDEDFARHLRKLARPIQIAYAKLMSHSMCNPVGVECVNKSHTAWAVVMPNVKTAANQEDWRVQVFDESGFCSHHCHATLQEAVEHMLGSGFLTVDAGALDRLAVTPQWALGVRTQELRDQHNRGAISFPELCTRMRALQAGT